MSTKDFADKDYYKVLGVSKDAKPEQIKKAFRKIARDNHPDSHPGDKAAEARFKEASEANDVLSDPRKRKEYDQARSLFGAGGGFRFPGGGGRTSSVNVEDFLRTASNGDGLGDVFSNLFGGAGSARSTARRSRRGADVTGETTIDFIDAIDGTTVSLQMVSQEACSACRGTGARAGSLPTTCPSCQGSGIRANTTGDVFASTEPCPQCNGRGLIVEDPCPICHGSGRARSTRTMQVRIPAGVEDGKKIRIRGKGSPGENGGSAGDLYVLVHVRAHPIFGRDGSSVTVDVPVTFPEAALGAEVSVPRVDGGTVRLKIPAGTPDGRTFRIRGRGVPRSNGTKGDLLATVQVVVPENLNDSARDLLTRFRDEARQPNPRPWEVN